MTGHRCPLCRAEGKTRLHLQSPRFLCCDECGAYYRDPFPDEATLSLLYAKSWSAPGEEGHDETGNTSAAVARSLVDSLAGMLGRGRLAGARVLDYGAGHGAMSLELQKRKARVVSVEPYGHEHLAALGIPTYRELDEIPAAVRFEGIVCLEVIEHLRDPRTVLSRLYERLLPGGWLLLTTPNAAGLPARLMGSRWREAGKAGHIVLFTPAALARSLLASGFTDVRRPHNFIRYPGASLLRRFAHFGMQRFRIDGSLRVVARRP
jgi:2-polyprenyl-3-methyl-5-hydroxy-6-metoxy-1,4-benzoquinol methylase